MSQPAKQAEKETSIFMRLVTFSKKQAVREQLFKQIDVAIAEARKAIDNNASVEDITHALETVEQLLSELKNTW